MRNFKKVRRTFSTEFKKEKVGLIEQGKLKIKDVCKTYEVSDTAVRKWIIEFGQAYMKTERVVVEKISEEAKTLELIQKVAELERVIGRQQLQIIYKDAVIKSASEVIGEDIEKKYDSQQ